MTLLKTLSVTKPKVNGDTLGLGQETPQLDYCLFTAWKFSEQL